MANPNEPFTPPSTPPSRGGGGSLGGIGVDVVMAVGAYLVIPLLNVGFLLFLQFTQPEV